MANLDGVALVAGAGSGIGRETAFTFAERGVTGLVVADLKEQAVHAVAEESKKFASSSSFRVVAVHVDVKSRESVDKMVAAAVAEFQRIDYFVNSAGIGVTMEAPVVDMPTDEFDNVHNVNARGTFFCTAAVGKVMLAQGERFVEGRSGRRSLGRGAIVNIASWNGISPVATHVQYGSSKYAAVGISMTAAMEMARKGVRLNVILPGWVDTPMMHRDFERQKELPKAIEALSPAGRMAYPEEIAGAIHFLCTPDATYITGTTLTIDAGITLTRGFA